MTDAKGSEEPAVFLGTRLLTLLEGGKKLKEAVEIEQNCNSIDSGNMVLWMLWYVIKSDRTQARDSDRHPTLLIDQGQSSLAFVLRK